jgi:hypothetical protein
VGALSYHASITWPPPSNIRVTVYFSSHHIQASTSDIWNKSAILVQLNPAKRRRSHTVSSVMPVGTLELTSMEMAAERKRDCVLTRDRKPSHIQHVCTAKLT